MRNLCWPPYRPVVPVLAGLLAALIPGIRLDAADPRTPALDAVVQSYHSKGEFDGVVLIARQGEVIYRQGFGLADRAQATPNTPETLFPICSITKQFTALLAMQLVASGALRLDGVVTDYLPDFRPDTGSRIHLRDLFMHTSGLPSLDEALPAGPDEIPGVYTSADPRFADPAYLVRTFGGGDLPSKPGETFRYNNLDYLVLAVLIEKVTGQTFAQRLQERILDPLAMRQTRLAPPDSAVPGLAVGYVPGEKGSLRVEPTQRLATYGAAGGMISTVDDLLRWDRALDADRLLPREWREVMFTPRRELGSVALGSWVYTANLAGVPTKPRLIERQGNIGAFNTLNVRGPDDGISLILYSNVATANLGNIYAGKGLAHDLLKVVYSP